MVQFTKVSEQDEISSQRVFEQILGRLPNLEQKLIGQIYKQDAAQELLPTALTDPHELSQLVCEVLKIRDFQKIHRFERLGSSYWQFKALSGELQEELADLQTGITFEFTSQGVVFSSDYRDQTDDFEVKSPKLCVKEDKYAMKSLNKDSILSRK